MGHASQKRKQYSHMTQATLCERELTVVWKVGLVCRRNANQKRKPDSVTYVGLSLFLVLVLAPTGFSGYSGFPNSSKTNIFNFQFDLGGVLS